MLSKEEIDNEFTSNYNEFLVIAKALNQKNKKRHDERMLVNEAYLEVIGKADRIDKKNKVRRYAIQFIKKSVVWENSGISIKGEGGKCFQGSGRERKQINELELFQQDQRELQLKIEQHERELKFNELTEKYIDECRDSVKIRLFKSYAKEGVNTIRGTASKYGISKDLAAKELNKMLTDFRGFAKAKNYI